VTYVVALLVLLLKGDPTGGAEGLAELALIPTAWSLFALITPLGGGWWWRTNMGGREPSERERSAYCDALELLSGHASHTLREPSGWFVIDSPQPDAAVCGDTLMVSRGLFESEYLPAVLAHELGHLNSSDDKLTAALNRVVIHPPPTSREREPRQRAMAILADDRVTLTITLIGALIWLLRKTVAFAKGGLGLRITAPFWGSYWREREYVADQYAASLGQAEELADFLEIHALIHDHPVPFIWLTEHTHPPSELRVDRLREAGSGPLVQVAPGSEPVKAAPSEPPAAGPDGPALTEPKPSAGRALMWAGRALPRSRGHR